MRVAPDKSQPSDPDAAWVLGVAVAGLTAAGCAFVHAVRLANRWMKV